jgi:para-aminobenzoate synthetase/4-amino-4-deoxychorismate lyase
VLVNESGHVAATTTANLAVQLDGRWWSPPLGCGLLPGVEGAGLLERGVLSERTITRRDLDAVTALALVSSLRGWQSARLSSRPEPGRTRSRTTGAR